MMKKQKLPFDILDSIRGIAALYVTIAHCRGVLWMGGSEFVKQFPRSNWDIWDYMMVGSSMLTRMAVEFVIVFFVLSGFSIAHSLSTDLSAPGFYKRRFIRIYPSYLIALLWAAIVYLITKASNPEWYDGTYTEFAFIRTMEMNHYLEPSQVARNVFYMPGNGFITPFWSLTYEVIFYILAPFLLRKATIYLLVSAVLFLSYQVVPGFWLSLHLPEYLFRFLVEFNIYFAAGVALYKYFDKVMEFYSSIPRRYAALVILAVLLGMYALNFKLGGETVYNFLASALFSIAVILYFIRYQVRIPWLTKIGQYSYTLYITHFASIYLYLAGCWWLLGIDKVNISNYLIWMPAVFFCLLVAYCQYQLIEKNTKKILDRLRRKPKPVQAFQ